MDARPLVSFDHAQPPVRAQYLRRSKDHVQTAGIRIEHFVDAMERRIGRIQHRRRSSNVARILSRLEHARISIQHVYGRIRADRRQRLLDGSVRLEQSVGIDRHALHRLT